MSNLLSITQFTQFLNEYYKDEILELAKDYPENTILELAFSDINNGGLKKQFEDNPSKFLEVLRSAAIDLINEFKPPNTSEFEEQLDSATIELDQSSELQISIAGYHKSSKRLS